MVFHHQRHLPDRHTVDHGADSVGIHQPTDGDYVLYHLHAVSGVQCYDGAVRAREASGQVYEVEPYEADISVSVLPTILRTSHWATTIDLLTERSFS